MRSNGIGATIQNERLGYFSHQGQTKNGRKVYVREQNGAQTQYLYFWDWGPNNGANWFIGLDPQLKPRGKVHLVSQVGIFYLKFIYSEKATKICKIFTLLLTTVHTVKSKVKISQNFVAFSEYMNFIG